MDKRCFLGKLAHLNYCVAIHPGDAKRRLGSQALFLFVIDSNIIPKIYKKDFQQMVQNIKCENLNNPIGMQINFHGKRNTTIVKYIKLLLDIEAQLRNEIEDC